MRRKLLFLLALSGFSFSCLPPKNGVPKPEVVYAPPKTEVETEVGKEGDLEEVKKVVEEVFDEGVSVDFEEERERETVNRLLNALE